MKSPFKSQGVGELMKSTLTPKERGAQEQVVKRKARASSAEIDFIGPSVQRPAGPFIRLALEPPKQSLKFLTSSSFILTDAAFRLAFVLQIAKAWPPHRQLARSGRGLLSEMAKKGLYHRGMSID
jgi:hypothetical protein